MEKKDIPYEYFSKTYGIKFDKLSFERKKFFFEHLVMRSCCKHSQKERLEASYININDASNSPRVNYSQVCICFISGNE